MNPVSWEQDARARMETMEERVMTAPKDEVEREERKWQKDRSKR